MRWFPGTRILTWVDDTWLSREGYQALRPPPAASKARLLGHSRALSAGSGRGTGLVSPGARPMWRPPRTCMWRWATLLPESGPMLSTRREPRSARPSAKATQRATSNISARSSPWPRAMAAASTMCSRGMTSTWVGATGRRSRKAKHELGGEHLCRRGLTGRDGAEHAVGHGRERTGGPCATGGLKPSGPAGRSRQATSFASSRPRRVSTAAPVLARHEADEGLVLGQGAGLDTLAGADGELEGFDEAPPRVRGAPRPPPPSFRGDGSHVALRECGCSKSAGRRGGCGQHIRCRGIRLGASSSGCGGTRARAATSWRSRTRPVRRLRAPRRPSRNVAPVRRRRGGARGSRP